MNCYGFYKNSIYIIDFWLEYMCYVIDVNGYVGGVWIKMVDGKVFSKKDLY